jgi:hypothetical protein
MKGLRPATLALLAGATAAAAQEIPPHLLAAFSLGGASYRLSQASPCFPAQPGAAAALQRRMAEAIARLGSDPAQMEAFQGGARLASMQQRYIARSDPAACAEVRDLLNHLLGP